MRPPAPAPFCLALLGLLIALPASARLGESQDDFDRRILQPDVGRFVAKRKNPDPAREEEIQRQQPFFPLNEFFPEGTRERRYWKSAVAKMLHNENGWRIHVFFHDNRSILEAYERAGDTLNEFEIQNILQANRGTSEWNQLYSETGPSLDAPFGCDYALADGTLKARVIGNWVMIYSTQLETHVKNRLRVLRESEAAKQAERIRQQQLTAPESTSNF